MSRSSAFCRLQTSARRTRLVYCVVSLALWGGISSSTAVADIKEDCDVLRGAIPEYSHQAKHFAALRKIAEPSPAQGPNAELKHQLAEEARDIGSTLRDLAGHISQQELKNLYWEDANSFDFYADAVISSIDSGDTAAVREAHSRNVRAVLATNDGFHRLCRS